MISVLQLITQIEALQHFFLLNEELQDCNKTDGDSLWCSGKIKTLSYIHEKLCNIIDEFNDKQGLQIAIQICTVSSLVINDLYFRVARSRDRIELANMVLQITHETSETMCLVFYCVSKRCK